MKQAILKNNPFSKVIDGVPPFGKAFLWEKLNDWKSQNGNSAYIADYGAYNGSMLKSIFVSGIIDKSIGFELNKEVVEANKNLLPNSVQLTLINKNPVLPVADDTFDALSMIGVLEHIYDQSYILDELNRVIKKGGIFVVQVPGKHLFSFLDFGNWKFVFPRIHQIYYELKYSKVAYHERYVECKNGLIGDIEKEKAWHQHFSQQELKKLLKEHNFEVIQQDGFGLFFRVFHNLRYLSPKFLKGFWDGLISWDSQAFQQAEIFVVAQKNN